MILIRFLGLNTLKRSIFFAAALSLLAGTAMPVSAQQPSPDYAALTQRDQAGDTRLRCAQIGLMLGEMNGIVANGIGTPASTKAKGVSDAAGRAVGNSLKSKARGLFSSLGGGILGDLASAVTDKRAAPVAAQSDPNASIKQAAAARRDRLLELASAKNCSGDANITQARTAAQSSSLQARRDTPTTFRQRNDYLGGIQDCTREGSCSGDVEPEPTQSSPCRGGNLPGQFCGAGELTPYERNLVNNGVTLKDAQKCNAVYTIAGLLKYRHDWSDANQALLDKIPDRLGGQNIFLWHIIWYLAPTVRQASADQKQGYFYRARDTPIYDAQPIYESNVRLLLNDYNYCIAKGLTPFDVPGHN